MLATATESRTRFLRDEFLDQYPDFPLHMNPLGQFVYYRTYSRRKPAGVRWITMLSLLIST
jgi:ribonucleoside-triphosphate reductase